ncbi:MAG: hypothetical protein COT38_04995 [Candidatus Omnitrophica bacterium CG08_land_8_20_14_0_20_41_16]|uniref:DUF1573 domain-containing protein n=1 Tax=Candidatus Sherwoodlollariibacterium unditelluris TaxID=1974757 RepID=A0A2G9YHX7_9BACT|nr:MAG: hypothetical protein COX41_06080 [Candidatus Omnitrophica bacterium CG23_combo_of_CG06-09_8_20_14_all_41_10]PIS33505.1 MAG: hypothetical protein COT38_04995 [Candidatus Omnitrophica bacterium CG08_land_8_20_14_0_20_41_16]
MFKACIVVLLSLFALSGCYPPKQKSLIERPFGTEGDPYTKDFGLIKAGEIVRQTFVIKNESKKVLNIKGVTTSCGCTTSEIKHKMLMPGESTNLDVKFNSKGYSGGVEQFVYVNTDSLDTPIIRFIIKAQVTKQ